MEQMRRFMVKLGKRLIALMIAVLLSVQNTCVFFGTFSFSQAMENHIIISILFQLH